MKKPKIETVPNYWHTYTARISIAIAILAGIVDVLGLFALQLGTFGAKLIAILSICIAVLRAIRQHGEKASGSTNGDRSDRAANSSGDRGSDTLDQKGDAPRD